MIGSEPESRQQLREPLDRGLRRAGCRDGVAAVRVLVVVFVGEALVALVVVFAVDLLCACVACFCVCVHVCVRA
jgi:hypothetical protein